VAGVPDLWEGYEGGGRIDQPGMVTINDSDHGVRHGEHVLDVWARFEANVRAIAT
jgi:hypothetical protein